MKGEKLKRPERELYIAPALRFSQNKDCEDKMQYPKEYYASEDDSSRNCNSSQTRSTNIVRRVQFDCSSSNPRIESDKSGKDDDSSDFEESSSESNELMDDQEIMGIMGTNQNHSNHHWNEEGTGKSGKNCHDIETTSKSRANIMRDSGLKETKYDRGLFFSCDDNFSDIEALDCNLTKGRILTSTPNSDIDDQKVLDAAKYDPEEEESGMESTLLGQSDIRETTIVTNRNKYGYNFEIHDDPSSVTSQPKDFLEIFGNNYIPPPVPPALSASRLPPIHRLPFPVSSPQGFSVLRRVSPQNIPQINAQLRHLFHPSLQSRSSLQSPSFNLSNSSRMPSDSRYRLSLRLRLPSPIPPPHSPKERFDHLHAPQGASSFLYLHPRRPSSQTLESNQVDDSFYIPPPVPRPQQIRYLNQRENVRSRQPNSTSVVNKILYDEESWPNS